MPAEVSTSQRVEIPTKQQMRDLDAIRPGLQAWLRSPLSPGLDVLDVRLPTGAGVANETLLVQARRTTGGKAQEVGYVVRVGASDHLFLGMDVEVHYKMYEALSREADIPSPPVIGFEPDRALFGHPFFVMDRVAGKVPADNPNFYETGWVIDLTTDERRALWRNTVGVMAKLHRLDPAKFSFLERPQLGANGLEQELRHWLNYAQWCGGDKYPIVRKASAWLVDNLPRNPPPGLSWGDSRPPNIIYQGVDCAAVLDWDMVSLAGAECDLAWWTLMDQNYTCGRGVTRPTGLGTPRETIALWQELVGRRAENLDWHLVLNAFRSRLVMVRLPAMLRASGQITAEQQSQLADHGEMEWLGPLLDRPMADRFEFRLARLGRLTGGTVRTPGEAFKIAVPDEVLADLRQRLDRTRWPKPAQGPDWDLGTSLPFMQRVVERWRGGYDWRAWETRLNGMEQYRIPLGGMAIHAFVERGSGASPMPIVLTHGWPGSPVELLEMIQPLAHPERFGGSVEDAFTVVVPGLPGCGFSDPPPGPISPRDVGQLWAEMMGERFGFERYMAHGGDWGAVVSSWMAVDRAPGLVGLHLDTAVLQAAWSFATHPLTDEEQAHMGRMAARQVGETAYQAVHGTKPLSLAYGITDSPAGLAAWILEKFQGWTVGGQQVDPPFDLDHLITNVMLYWLGDAQAVSWMYRYLVDMSGFVLPEGERAAVPTGFCLFPDDIAVPPPDALLARAYDMIHCTRAKAGGHFPGIEHPKVLVDDIRAFRRKLAAG